MERLRQFFNAPGHTAEHVTIRERMTDQQIRIDRLDATVDANRAKDLAEERRRLTLRTHPSRRAEDRR